MGWQLVFGETPFDVHTVFSLRLAISTLISSARCPADSKMCAKAAPSSSLMFIRQFYKSLQSTMTVPLLPMLGQSPDVHGNQKAAVAALEGPYAGKELL